MQTNVSKELSMVVALRLLINASRSAYGPSRKDAIELTEGMNLPDGWLDAILYGWAHPGHKTRKKLYVKEMAKHTPIRYISTMLIPPIDIRDVRISNRICKLCGTEPESGHRTWHAACWKALEPQTSRYWSRIRRQILSRDGERCIRCGVCVNSKKWNRTMLHEWKRDNKISSRTIFNIDHIVPIVSGGTHDEHNLQLLCVVCHKKKTASEAQERMMERMVCD